MTLAINLATTPDAIYQEALRAVCRLTELNLASVTLFEGNGTMRVRAWVGLSEDFRAAVERNTHWTGPRELLPSVVNDVTREASLSPLLHQIEAEGIHAMATAPLRVGTAAIGRLDVYAPLARHLGEEELRLLGVVAAHAACAIEHQQREEGLRRITSFHRAALEHLKQVVFETDASGLLVFLNPFWERVAGVSVAEGLGQPLGAFVHEADRSTATEVHTRLASGVSPEASAVLRIQRPDGGLRWVEVFASANVGPGGEFLGGAGTLLDVTAHWALAEELEDAESVLWERRRREGLATMAAGAAHDYGNLLMGIQGNLGMAIDDLPPDSPAREPLYEAATGARRAAELTEQLLTYAGGAAPLSQWLDVSRVAQESAEALASSIGKHAALVVDCPPGLPSVQGDARQVRQLVTHLLTNAMEAMGKKSEPGSIVLRVSAPTPDAARLARALNEHAMRVEPCVSLLVTDSGTGMEEATRRRMFDPFFTTKLHGRGLGLSAVLGIVNGHKGAIIVDTVPDRGTTVQVLLPVAANQVAADETSETSPADALTGTATVLLVEDDELVRRATGRSLRRAGYRVLFAENGRRALEVMEAHASEVDVVLLDVVMPEMDGPETVVNLTSRWPEVGVVVTSAFHDATMPMNSSSKVGFLRKPYSNSALQALIERAFQRRKSAGLR